MASPAQIAANRTNAQRSTGPTSPEGKARAASNSFKHGLYAPKHFQVYNADPNYTTTCTRRSCTCSASTTRS